MALPTALLWWCYSFVNLERKVPEAPSTFKRYMPLLRPETSMVPVKSETLLEERIACARLVEPDERPADEVRFGSTVTFLITAGTQHGIERTFTLVGVDEAQIAEGRIAFTAPIAQALMGKKVGDTVEFRMGDRLQTLGVRGIR